MRRDPRRRPRHHPAPHRRAVAALVGLVGLLVVVPLVTGFLPSSFQEAIAKYFPAQAGMAVFRVVPDRRPVAVGGFAVLVAYGALSLAAGAVLLVRRNA